MSAELLRLRVEVLERGVSDVQRVLDAGEAVRNALRKARSEAEAAGVFIEDVSKLASNSDPTILALQEFFKAVEKDPIALDGIERREIAIQPARWNRALENLRTGLDSYRSTQPELSERLEAVKRELRQIENRMVRFGEGFEKRIGEQIRELSGDIGQLRADLHTRPGEPAALWERYFGTIQPKAERLFAEHLHLLGGLSIRERGLTIGAFADEYHLDELCALADWHFANELTLCLDLDRPLLALPGQNLSAEVPPWPILRLGFASWSIWGLPLTGHEFGKLVADASLAERGATRQWTQEIRAFGPAGLRLLIADAIGAWAEGPAYACALLFLTLNPTAPAQRSNKRVTDAERADLVLAVLNARDGDSQGREEGGYEYRPFLEKLADRWHGEQTRPGETSARADLLRALPDRVIKRFQLKKPFDLSDWRISADVLGHLERDEKVPAASAAGLRHLTNAAWRGHFTAVEGLSDRPSAAIATDLSELERRALREGLALVRPPGVRASGLDQGGPAAASPTLPGPQVMGGRTGP